MVNDKSELPDRPDDGARERKRLIRRATLWAVGLSALTVVVAFGGAALIAWGLSAFGDLPFIPTWLILAAVVLIVPLVVIGIREALKRAGQ